MPAGHVNRTELSANYQGAGDVYDDTKTEGAFEVVAQQVDLNWDDYAVLKAALAAVAAGASGAHYVKSAPITGVTGGNVYLQLANIFAQLQAAVMGTIPDSSIAYAKLDTATKAMLALKAQEAWIAPTLVNSWVNFGVSDQAQYMKDEFGFVHLRGQIKNGTVGGFTPVFTLPVGYRPTTNGNFPVVSNSLFGFVAVDIGGVVYVQGGSNVWVDLSNVSFKAG